MVKVALMVEDKKMTEAQDEAIRVVLSDGGRIVIPASVRKALGVGPGDSLSLRVEDKELRILPQREAIRRAQEIVSRRIASGRSLVKELSEERKLEASRG
jgi:AbrB family looped-hinge helix DNA binding protein